MLCYINVSISSSAQNSSDFELIDRKANWIEYSMLSADQTDFLGLSFMINYGLALISLDLFKLFLPWLRELGCLIKHILFSKIGFLLKLIKLCKIRY
jgi:hypothetical protein